VAQCLHYKSSQSKCYAKLVVHLHKREIGVPLKQLKQKKRNRLSPTRLQDLVNVRVNSNLKRKNNAKEDQIDSVPIELDKIKPDVTYIFYNDGDNPIDHDQEGDSDRNDGGENDGNVQ